ncbi:MAG TPA: S41 family peptidase [Candidatus Obscuribacter sp.]|nr:S41 family peptidase [Candidatus Obscuribacter sp.]
MKTERHQQFKLAMGLLAVVAVVGAAIFAPAWFAAKSNAPPVIIEQSMEPQSAATPEKSHAPEVAAAVTRVEKVPKQCQPSSQSEFDGKLLYGCVFDILYRFDLALLDQDKRAAFKTNWEHRFDEGDTFQSKEQTDRAIASMVHALGELHTVYLNEKNYRGLLQSLSGELPGVGLSVARFGMFSAVKALGDEPAQEDLQALSRIGEATPVVVYPQPFEGTPAALAGLQMGDRITAVDGKPVLGLTMDEVVNMIRGKAGTGVEIKVARTVGDTVEARTFALTRSNLKVPMLETRKMGDFVYMKLRSFSAGYTSQEVMESLYTACTGKNLPMESTEVLAVTKSYVPERDCALTGLVLDMRANPGGRMEQAMDIAHMLLVEGPTITTLTRDGDSIAELREVLFNDHNARITVKNGEILQSKNEPRVFRLFPDNRPIVVLVDGNSASASEILAGLLQRNGRALIVGEPSFGKTVGQNVVPLVFGTGLKITTFSFLPGGAELGVAVLPDREVAASDAFKDDPIQAEDVQLTAAVNAIAELNGKVEALAKLKARVQEEHSRRDSRMLDAQGRGLELIPVPAK